MWVTLGNTYAKLTRSTPEELAWLDDYLSFEDSKARFAGAKKGGSKPKPIGLLNGFNQTFPAGFVPLIKKQAAEQGFTVDVSDPRVVPTEPNPDADLAWLHDFQREAVRRVIARARGILWLPTGSGKTEIAAGVIRALPCRWLFVVNSVDLMDQTARRFEARGVPDVSTEERAAEDTVRLLQGGSLVGRIGEGHWLPGTTVTCATFQSLYRALKGANSGAVHRFLETIQGLIVDECHILPSDTFLEVAMALRNAYFRVGLSGTPLARGDKKSLLAIGALGPVIHRIKPEVLMERGILSKPKIRFIKHKQVSTLPTWQGVYGEVVVRSATRNRLLVALAGLARKPSILFVKEVKHGKRLEDLLLRAGIQARFVWGTHSVDYRRTAIRDLVAGRVDVLVASAVFYVGIDVPELASMVIGAAGKSIIQTLQRLGRGMRTDGGRKMDFECWDVYDEGIPMMEKWSKGRLNAFIGEGYDTEVLSTTPTNLVLPMKAAGI